MKEGPKSSNWHPYKRKSFSHPQGRRPVKMEALWEWDLLRQCVVSDRPWLPASLWARSLALSGVFPLSVLKRFHLRQLPSSLILSSREHHGRRNHPAPGLTVLFGRDSVRLIRPFLSGPAVTHGHTAGGWPGGGLAWRWPRGPDTQWVCCGLSLTPLTGTRLLALDSTDTNSQKLSPQHEASPPLCTTACAVSSA